MLYKLNSILPVSSTANKEVAVHIVFTILPFADNYRYLVDSVAEYEKLSMDASISAEARSMCHNVVSFVQKVDIEKRGRIQVLLTTGGVLAAVKLVKYLGKNFHRGWFSWF